MTRLRINYLARRHPSIPRDQWVARWRQHWDLAAGQPRSASVRRYVQYEVLWDRDQPPHDGAASAEYVSPEARRVNRTDHDYHRIMQADEVLVFDRLIGECSFVAEHEMVHGTSTGPFKVMRYLRGTKSAEVWDDHDPAELVGLLSGCVGYARNRTVAPDQTARWGLDVAGSDELWFTGLVDALSAARSPALATYDGERRALRCVVHQVVTDETVLKG